MLIYMQMFNGNVNDYHYVDVIIVLLIKHIFQDHFSISTKTASTILLIYMCEIKFNLFCVEYEKPGAQIDKLKKNGNP